MQKKYLLLAVTVGCVIVNAGENSNPMHDQHAQKNSSYFDHVPESLRNKIPQEMRNQIEEEYDQYLNDRARIIIDKDFEGVLTEEFDKPGSIDERCQNCIKKNNAELEQRKKNICTCGRQGNGWIFSDDSPTHVKDMDAREDEYTQRLNRQCEQKAQMMAARFSGIKKEVKAADQVYSDKLVLLRSYYNSVKMCGTDVECNENNGVFPKHLTPEFRENIFAKVFNDAVKSCGEQGIATEEELSKIWEKRPNLRKHLDNKKQLNDSIDDLIDPVRIKAREDRKIEERENQKLKEKEEEEKRLQALKDQLEQKSNAAAADFNEIT